MRWSAGWEAGLQQGGPPDIAKSTPASLHILVRDHEACRLRPCCASRGAAAPSLHHHSAIFIGPRQRLHAAPPSLLRQPQLTAHALPYRAKRACRLLSPWQGDMQAAWCGSQGLFPKVVPSWLRYLRAGGHAPYEEAQQRSPRAASPPAPAFRAGGQQSSEPKCSALPWPADGRKQRAGADRAGAGVGGRRREGGQAGEG